MGDTIVFRNKLRQSVNPVQSRNAWRPTKTFGNAVVDGFDKIKAGTKLSVLNRYSPSPTIKYA